MESRRGKNERPSTATPGCTRNPDRKQEHNTKENLKTLEDYCKGQTEKHPHSLHQPHNTVELQDVGKDLLERQLEENKAELEIYKERNLELTEEIEMLRYENEVLNEKIKRLSKIDGDEKQSFPVKSTDSLVQQEILVATGRAKRTVSDLADKYNASYQCIISELVKMKESQFEFEKKYTELESKFLVQTEKHVTEIDELHHTIESLKDEKENCLRELDEEKEDRFMCDLELRSQHEREKNQLLNTIGRLTVEKDNLLKR